MPIFEKIHNYSFRQAVWEIGNPAPPTKIEMGWLKKMLENPQAKELLTDSFYEKLLTLVANETPFPNSSHVEEKGKPSAQYSSASVHLPVLRAAMRNCKSVIISYLQKNSKECFDVNGIPCRLEFSMARREWYLLWINPVEQPNRPNTTPLRMIRDARIGEGVVDWEYYQSSLREWFEQSQEMVQIKALECYPGALLSVLNAFSCFYTMVSSGKQKNTLQLHVRFLADEREYVLQKIRFLGSRVKVEEPEAFKKQMTLEIGNALARYSGESRTSIPANINGGNREKLRIVPG